MFDSMIRSFLIAASLALLTTTSRSDACCPAPPGGKPVVNADQTVVVVWDPITKTEHFIRRATFKSDADDFGFLIPTPAQPELEESGDEAFAMIAKLTAPKIERRAKPMDCSGCMRSKSGALAQAARAPEVVVLEEKMVAGFHATVLEAKSAGALVGWLKDHGYAFSPAVAAWAKPYVDGGWKITALRVAKGSSAGDPNRVSAASLRLSFKTDAPLFPYREPDTTADAPALGATSRLLRIYFIGDARYDGSLVGAPWTGRSAWAGRVTPAERDRILGALNLPASAMPKDPWLTELEDEWPYRMAPSDLTFARSATQAPLEREPVIEYTAIERRDDVAFAGILFVPFVWSWRRRRAAGSPPSPPQLPT